MKSVLQVRAKKALITLATLVFTAVSITSCITMAALAGGSADHFSTTFCYKGQWSDWENKYLYSFNKIRCYRYSNGDIIGLALCDSGGNVYYKFKINNYTPGYKNFYGTVEYFVNDSFPTAEALAKANYFVRPNYRTDQTPSVKRTARATIKIVNDEKRPEVFNIFYDNVGVGISVRNIYWEND